MKSMQAKIATTAPRNDWHTKRNSHAHGLERESVDSTPKTYLRGRATSAVKKMLTVAGLVMLPFGVQAMPQATNMPAGASAQKPLPDFVTLRDLLATSDKWMGHRVALRGIVTNVYTNRMFTLRGTGDMKNIRFPVLSRKPVPGEYGRSNAHPLRVGDEAQVTGVVTRFAVEEMEKMTGAHYVERDYQTFLSKPALLASLVVIQPGIRQTAADRETVHSVKTFATSVDLLAIPDQAAWVGKKVRIDAAHVESVISDRGFYLGDTAGKRLFAVLDPALDNGKMEQAVVVKKGQTLALEGTIEKMPSEQGALKRWTVDANEAAQLTKQPVYLHVRYIGFK